MPNALAKIRTQAKKIMKKRKSSSIPRRKKSTVKRSSPSRKSHRVGSVRPENLRGTLAETARQVQSELGWKLAAQRTAKTKKEKKGLQPKINELTRQLKALKGY